MRQHLFISIILLLLASVARLPNARADDRPSRFRGDSGTNAVREDGKTVLYKKRNVVDFDGSLIEGEVRNPSEFYFVHRPEEKFDGLVKKRKNFHKEMLRDTVMIR